MSYGSERDRQRKSREYESFRRQVPKTDVEFLDEAARSTRVCETADELDWHCFGLLQIADAALEKGNIVRMVLDTEDDYIIPGTKDRLAQPYFWHKRALEEDGVSLEEIAKRERRQRELDREYAALKSSKVRQRRREEFRRRSEEEGLRRSDCFAFTIGCVEDEDDEF